MEGVDQQEEQDSVAVFTIWEFSQREIARFQTASQSVVRVVRVARAALVQLPAWMAPAQRVELDQVRQFFRRNQSR